MMLLKAESYNSMSVMQWRKMPVSKLQYTFMYLSFTIEWGHLTDQHLLHLLCLQTKHIFAFKTKQNKKQIKKNNKIDT